MSSSSSANEEKMDDDDLDVDLDVQLNTLESLSVRESYRMISNFNDILDILKKNDIKEQSKGGLLSDADIFENLYLLFNDQYKNTLEKICMKPKSNEIEIKLVGSQDMDLGQDMDVVQEPMSELEQWKSELEQWKSKLNELQRFKYGKRKFIHYDHNNPNNPNNPDVARTTFRAKRTKFNHKGGVLSDYSKQMDLIRNTDCVHDFGNEKCSELKEMCGYDKEHVDGIQLLESVIQFNQTKGKKHLIINTEYEENEENVEDISEIKKVLDTSQIENIFDTHFPEKLIYIIDFDTGEAFNLLKKYKMNNAAKHCYVYKGVEVNYDSAGKKSDKDIIDAIDGDKKLKIYGNDPRVNTNVYFPPTNMNECDNKIEWLPFQQFFTNRKIYLLSASDNKAMCLIEKKKENDNTDGYVLVDKTFGQKKDIKQYDFLGLFNKYLEYKSSSSNSINVDDVSQATKYTEEHLIAKRLGDQGQALRALYLPDSILVTHDRFLLSFALFIGVKHIIFCNYNKTLSLYYDQTAGVEPAVIVDQLKKKISEVKKKLVNATDDDEIERKVSELKTEKENKASELKTEMDEKAKNLIFPYFTFSTDNTNTIINTQYTVFINRLNEQLTNILLYNIAKKNYDNYYNYITTLKDAMDEEKNIQSQDDKEKITILTKSFTAYSNLKNIDLTVNTIGKLNIKNYKDLKLFKYDSIRTFLRKFNPFIKQSNSEFENDTRFSIIEFVILNFNSLGFIQKNNNYINIENFVKFINDSKNKHKHGDMFSEKLNIIYNKIYNKQQGGGDPPECSVNNDYLKIIQYNTELESIKYPLNDDYINYYKKEEILQLIFEQFKRFISLDDISQFYFTKIFTKIGYDYIEAIKILYNNVNTINIMIDNNNALVNGKGGRKKTRKHKKSSKLSSKTRRTKERKIIHKSIKKRSNVRRSNVRRSNVNKRTTHKKVKQV